MTRRSAKSAQLRPALDESSPLGHIHHVEQTLTSRKIAATALIVTIGTSGPGHGAINRFAFRNRHFFGCASCARAAIRLDVGADLIELLASSRPLTGIRN